MRFIWISVSRRCPQILKAIYKRRHLRFYAKTDKYRGVYPGENHQNLIRYKI